MELLSSRYDQAALLLDMLQGLAQRKRDLLLAVSARNDHIQALQYLLGGGTVEDELGRLVATGWLVPGQVASQAGLGPVQTWRLRRGLEDALQMRQTADDWMRPLIDAHRAFWWESNAIFGMVWHPMIWAKVKIHYPGKDIASQAKRAAWAHGSMLGTKVRPYENFGLRREHTEQPTLREWADEHGLDWVT